MSDWNSIKRPFREALIAAYNWDRLALVLAYLTPSRRLDRITSQNKGFDTNVDEVIDHAVQTGWLEDLARGALEENPNHTGLKETVPQILQGVETEGKHYYQRPLADSAASMPLLSQEQLASLLQSFLGQADLEQEKPLPRMGDIFEIIDDPNQVLSSVFRVEPGQGIAAYEIKYVTERDGEEDVQGALIDSLLDAGGMLLLQSRAGLGKTREVAELAENLCRRHGWTVCVAKGGEADKTMNRLASYPSNLEGKRLLLIFDDLHRRAGSSENGPLSYAERLEALLDYLTEQMKPGSLRVLCTARSEPHHWNQIAFDQDQVPWKRFGVYELPEFTTSGLEQILTGLAERAGVSLEEDEVCDMVSNSDRTLRTLLDNVNFAKRTSQPLTSETWLPTQGESWDMRYREARGLYPGVQAVYEALHLIREAGLVTRLSYVSQLSKNLINENTQPAIEGLFNMGLLGKRDDIVDAFSDEQLIDSLQKTGGSLPTVSNNWDRVVEAISNVAQRPDRWPSDLAALTERLNKAAHYERSLTVADRAIEQGVGSADIFYNRGFARSQTADFAGAKTDFSAAIARGMDDGAVYVSRAGARFHTADYTGAEADLTTAIEHGIAHAMIFAGRGAARELTGNHAGAETDLSTAIHLGLNSAEVYLARGSARFYAEDYSGAEADLTSAIERGMDDPELYLLRAAAKAFAGDHQGLDEDIAAALERGGDHAAMYYLRGISRYDRQDYAGAETDLTTAIERGQDDANVYLLRGDARFNSSAYAEAAEDYSAAIERGFDEAPVYFFRGRSRRMIGDHAGAELDYTAAIERGQNDAFVFVLRGDARATNADNGGAEADYSAAIERGWDEAAIYFYRGRVRFEMDDYTGAEADLTAAIERGQDDADVYYWRAKARSNLLDAVGALHDFEATVERGHYDADVYYRRGIARQVNGDHQGAEADFNTAIERGLEDAAVHYWRGRARIGSDNPNGADSDLTRAIERGQDDGDVYKYRGWARISAGQFETAEEDLSTAIEKGEDDALVYFLRANARSKIGDFVGAESDYTAVIARGKADADSYYDRGLARYSAADYAGAEADFTAAIEQGSDDGAAHYFRGLSRYFIAAYAGAVVDFQAAIERGADDSDTNSYLGLVLRLTERWQEAANSYRRAVELDPTRYLDWLGLAASARLAGDKAAWQEALDKARPIADGDDQYDAACYASVAGNPDHALELLNRVLQAQPELAGQVKTDPDFYWLREDPRFVKLIERAAG